MKKILIIASLFLTVITVTVNAQSEVNQRSRNQKARIRQGENSGQLTNRERRNLKTEERAINQQKRVERQANGGHLTGAEKQQINREQNQESRRIYRDKHNARRRQ